MRAQKVTFDETAWDAQADRISLAILCLVSNTEFLLANGGQASCKLETENHFRLLNGQRRLPTGIMSSEPTSFGRLMILGEATVNSANKAPLRVSFPLIDTDLDPRTLRPQTVRSGPSSRGFRRLQGRNHQLGAGHVAVRRLQACADRLACSMTAGSGESVGEQQ